MVTKIFPTAYVDGIRDVSHVAYGTSVTPARCLPLVHPRAGPGAQDGNAF